jgi:hypothetical protein
MDADGVVVPQKPARMSTMLRALLHTLVMQSALLISTAIHVTIIPTAFGAIRTENAKKRVTHALCLATAALSSAMLFQRVLLVMPNLDVDGAQLETTESV